MVSSSPPPSPDRPTSGASSTDDEPAQRKSIFESPWYWVYLFATGALIALLLLGWKFGPRQAQIENKYLGHSAADKIAAGEQPEEGQLSTADRTIIGLAPLYALLGIVFVVAWIAVWRQLFLQKRSKPESGADLRSRAPPQFREGEAKP